MQVYLHIQIPASFLWAVFFKHSVFQRVKIQDWRGSESIQTVKDPWCNISLLPPLSLAVFGDLSAWMFCLSTMQEECLWGQGIVSPVRRSNPVAREKGSKDQAIQGMQGRGRVIPPLSESRASGLRWGELVSPNFPLIPEAHLAGLTVHDGSLFSAVACLCFSFSSHLLQYIVMPAAPIWIHPHFSPLFENKLKKAEPWTK